MYLKQVEQEGEYLYRDKGTEEYQYGLVIIFYCEEEISKIKVNDKKLKKLMSQIIKNNDGKSHGNDYLQHINHFHIINESSVHKHTYDCACSNHRIDIDKNGIYMSDIGDNNKDR